MNTTAPTLPGDRLRIGWLLLLFVIVAGAFSLCLPLGEASDETDHFALVRFIADTGHPPTSQAERSAIGPKGDASPIYHMLVAYLTQHVDVSLLPELPDAQAHPERFVATDGFRANRIFHTDNESFPFRGIVLAWHLGRLVSIPLGALTVLAVFLTVLQVYPRRPNLALATAGFAAFVPRFVTASAVINDDNLMIPLVAFCLYFAVRLVHGDRRRKTAVVLGLLAGAAAVVKYHSLILVIEMGCLYVLLAWQDRRRKTAAVGPCPEGGPLPVDRLWPWTLLALVLVVAPWLAYVETCFNQVDELGVVRGLLAPLGDPVAVAGLGRVFDASPAAAPGVTFGLAEWAGLFFRSFWIVYGWVQLFAPQAVYWILAIVSAIALTGLALAVLPLRRLACRPDDDETVRMRRVAILVLALHLALFVGITLLRLWMRPAREIGQGRYLYPAMTSVAFFFVLGLSEVFDRVRQHVSSPAKSPVGNRTTGDHHLSLGLAGSMLFLCILTLTVFILPHYRPYLPIHWIDPAAAKTMRREGLELAPGIVLTNVDQAVNASTRTGGEGVPVTLRWLATDEVDRDYLEQVCLLDGHSTPVTCVYRYPVNGRYPTRIWEPSYAVVDRFVLPVPACLPPGELSASLDLLPLRPDTAGASIDAAGPRKPLTLGSVEIGANPVDASSISPGVELWEDQGRASGTSITVDMARQALTLVTLHEAGTTPPAQAHLVAQAVAGGVTTWSPAPIGPQGESMSTVFTCPDGRVSTTVNFLATPNVLPGLYRPESGTAVPDVPDVVVRTRWRDFSPPDSPGQRAEATFGDTLVLDGFDVQTDARWGGDTVDVTGHWHALRVAPRHYLLNLYLTNSNLGVAGKLDWTLGGHYPNVLWAPGEYVTETYPLTIGPSAAPGIYSIELSLRDFGTRLRADAGSLTALPVRLPAGQEDASHLVLGEIRVRDPWEANLPAPFVSYHLGNQIVLLAYEVNGQPQPQALPPGGTLDAVLFWSATTTPDRDYTVFVQLVGADGQVWAQKDNQPQSGGYPTTRWDLRNTVVDRYNLVLKPDAPQGAYTLLVGMYDLQTGQRLPVVDGSGKIVAADAIPLVEVRVSP